MKKGDDSRSPFFFFAKGKVADEFQIMKARQLSSRKDQGGK
jgi:hypothetical protein